MTCRMGEWLSPRDQAGYGNRTRVYSLGSCRSTIEPIPQEGDRHSPRSLGPRHHSKGSPGRAKVLSLRVCTLVSGPSVQTGAGRYLTAR
jgi:hypothetical protein